MINKSEDQCDILDRGVYSNQKVNINVSHIGGFEGNIIAADFKRNMITISVEVPAHWVKEVKEDGNQE